MLILKVGSGSEDNVHPNSLFQTRDAISKVQFTPRFSLMAVFEEVPQFDWVMKYHEDDVVRFTVWDNVKRSHGEFLSRSINMFCRCETS